MCDLDIVAIDAMLKELPWYVSKAAQYEDSLREIENVMYGITANRTDRVDAGYVSSRGFSEPASFRLMERADAIRKKLNTCYNAIDKIGYMLQGLDDEELKLLTEYYEDGKSLDTIADEMYYSRQTLGRKRNSALKAMAQRYKF